MKPLDYYWYNKGGITLLLLPVSWLFCAIAVLRRLLYGIGILKVHQISVPVIIIGNISVGGTGKTPLVTWLVEQLRQEGYTPGLISRGYGGKSTHWPQQVRPDSDPRMVGDEAVLLSQRTNSPMAVGPNRVDAANALLSYNECDVIVADDGMQHYALGRDVEIAVVDSVRRFGNGHCLPAGPLREPLSRMKTVDIVVANGVAGLREFRMELVPDRLRNIALPEKSTSLEFFTGKTVHAVAGIGHPERFFRQLEKHGITVIEHPFPDHHPFAPEDIDFSDDLPVLMTEKDAVKCQDFANKQHWLVPVAAKLDERMMPLVLRLLKKAEQNVIV
ncbi:MAG: tetraacyldisaccharide 4'-kinase [Ectothiorhodospiraceae bacterium]|nr:tetraacyldisaccharide 4'-kinase [Ectothiorhodospiraceae bacterium]